MRPRVAFGVCLCDILGANATSQIFFFWLSKILFFALKNFFLLPKNFFLGPKIFFVGPDSSCDILQEDATSCRRCDTKSFPDRREMRQGGFKGKGLGAATSLSDL
jgi:hypothetical protein